MTGVDSRSGAASGIILGHLLPPKDYFHFKIYFLLVCLLSIYGKEDFRSLRAFRFLNIINSWLPDATIASLRCLFLYLRTKWSQEKSDTRIRLPQTRAQSNWATKSAECSFSKEGRHTQTLGYPIRLFLVLCHCPNIHCTLHPQQRTVVKLETSLNARLFMCVCLRMMADWLGLLFWACGEGELSIEREGIVWCQVHREGCLYLDIQFLHAFSPAGLLALSPDSPCVVRKSRTWGLGGRKTKLKIR